MAPEKSKSIQEIDLGDNITRAMEAGIRARKNSKDFEPDSSFVLPMQPHEMGPGHEERTEIQNPDLKDD